VELAIPRNGDGSEYARVTKRLRDKDGLPIGIANDNPILDKRMYEVEYPDGHKASLAATAITENMFVQADDPTMRATNMYCSRRSWITERMNRK
jgi:hypothetical protein